MLYRLPFKVRLSSIIQEMKLVMINTQLSFQGVMNRNFSIRMELWRN